MMSNAPETIWVDYAPYTESYAHVSHEDYGGYTKYHRAGLPPTKEQIMADPRVKALVDALKDASELAHGVSFSKSETMANWGHRVEQKVNAALAQLKDNK